MGMVISMVGAVTAGAAARIKPNHSHQHKITEEVICTVQVLAADHVRITIPPI